MLNLLPAGGAAAEPPELLLCPIWCLIRRSPSAAAGACLTCQLPTPEGAVPGVAGAGAPFTAAAAVAAAFCRSIADGMNLLPPVLDGAAGVAPNCASAVCWLPAGVSRVAGTLAILLLSLLLPLLLSALLLPDQAKLLLPVLSDAVRLM